MLFFLYQVISISFSYDKKVALNKVISNIVFLILPFSFVMLKPLLNKKSFHYLYFGMLTILIIFVLKVYFLMTSSLIKADFILSNFIREKFIEKSLFNIHAPYLAFLIVFTVICAFKIKFSNNKKRHNFIKFFVIIILITSLFFLSGLMSLVILMLFLVHYFMFEIALSNKIKAFIVLLILSSISLLIYGASNSHKEKSAVGSENFFYRIQNIGYDYSVRSGNIKSSIIVISENLFFGVGADGGIKELLKHRKKKTEAYINKHNSHNVFLEVFVRYGFIGFVIYMIIVINLIRKAIVNRDYYFKWFLIVFFIAGLTESYLERQIGLVFFVFISLFFLTEYTKVKRI